MPKRAAQSDEKCRTPKVVRNKDDSSARKIPRSKLLRTDKQTTAKLLSFFVGLLTCPLRGLNLFACYIGGKESTAEGIDPARAPRKFIPK